MLFGFLFIDLLLWIVAPIILFCLFYNDEKAWASAIILTVIGYVCFTNKDLLLDPLWWGQAVKYGLIYICIGIAFSLLKWKLETLNASKAFQNYLNVVIKTKEKLIADNIHRKERNYNNDEAGWAQYCDDLLPEHRRDIAKAWNSNRSGTVSYNHHSELLTVEPKDSESGWTVAYQKTGLWVYGSSWVVYWPFYAVLTVLNDIIKHVAEWFLDHFGSLYTKMANRSFSDIK